MRVYNHMLYYQCETKEDSCYTVLTLDYHVVMNFSDEHLDLQC